MQDGYGRTASATVTVTLADHYLLTGHINAPAGSYAATQVGFADDAARVPLANGTFTLNLPVGGAPRVLVADAPSHAPEFAALLGAFGANAALLGDNGSTTPNITLSAFSTATYALLRQGNGDGVPTTSAELIEAEATVDWLDLMTRTVIAQLALEAGGGSIGLPSAYKIATDNSVLAQIKGHFNATTIAQRLLQLRADAALLPLQSAPTAPASIIAYASDANAWDQALLLRPGSGNSLTYVTAYGGGAATWQASNGSITITPSGGPAAQIGALQLLRIGTEAEDVFGASLLSNGLFGSPLWAGELAPAFSASTNPPGFEIALHDTVFVPYNIAGFSHRLPVCSLPAGGAPTTRTHVFNTIAPGDTAPTGTIAETGEAFTWQQSAVLSIHYANDSIASFIYVARAPSGNARVIADVMFPGGEELLCSGVDVPVAP